VACSNDFQQGVDEFTVQVLRIHVEVVVAGTPAGLLGNGAGNGLMGGIKSWLEMPRK
jgi:hypothetical protein